MISLRRFSGLTVIAVLLAGLLCFSHHLVAQQTTGTVKGTVTDASGAPILQASVALTNMATGVRTALSTTAEGYYVFNLVNPGSYKLEVSSSGFQSKVISEVTVQVYATTQIDVTLNVASVSESIEVTAPVETINTSNAMVSTNVEQRWIPELPNNSRNVLALIQLAPGVQLTRDTPQMTNIEGSYARVNGQRSGSNVFALDGSDNSGAFRNGSLQFPNPEAVQEVQISTANTSAELGRQPGGIFNVITRSGTNEWHGSGFYFFRNKNFNANQWNRNRSGLPLADDNEKRGGGTFGGPVRKNKTFFFASYMAYRDNQAGLRDTVQFPTSAMWGGDFGQFTRQLYNPDSGMPLAGNQIPRALLDPVAANIAPLFPTVANLGDRFIWSFQDTTDNDELLGKIDHMFSDKHLLAVSYFTVWGNQTLPGSTGSPDFGPAAIVGRQHTFSARHTWIARPELLIQTQYSMAVHTSNRSNSNAEGRTLEDFGALWPLASPDARKQLPTITVADGFSGSPGILSYFKQPNQAIQSTVTWTKGSHNVKFGVEIRRSAVRQLQDGDSSTFDFNGRASSKPAVGQPVGIGVFGYAAADFIMGRSSTFSQRGIRDYNIFNWMQFFFVQDEWRINRKLTISPGLRYEAYQPAQESSNRMSSFVLGHQSSQYPSAPLHLAFPGDAGFPDGGFNRVWTNFAPRLGIAYDPWGDGKTAIRAGFGIYYSQIPMQSKMTLAEQTPWNPSASGGETRNLLDPWGTSRVVTYSAPPTPFSTDISNFNYPPRIALTAFELDTPTPYTTQWNFSIQRTLPKGMSMEAGYVGNRGLHFLQTYEFNWARWADNASTTNINNRRPLSQYGSIRQLLPRARSAYDALQLTFNARFNSDFMNRVVYTYGKSFGMVADDIGFGPFNSQAWGNPLNLDGEKMELAPRQTFRYFGIYQLPFLRNNRAWAGRILGGWQFTGTVAITSGSPLDVLIGQDWNFDGLNGDRPNQVAPVSYTSGDADQKMARFFDSAAFQRPDTRNTFGNAKRNALFGPGLWASNLSLQKRFAVTETSFFEFRGEAYNFLNHPALGNPNTTMSSVDYTRIVSKSGNRTMQLGLRFIF